MSNDLIVFKPDAFNPNRLKQEWNDAVWDDYYEEMRRYNRGLLAHATNNGSYFPIRMHWGGKFILHGVRFSPPT